MLTLNISMEPLVVHKEREKQRYFVEFSTRDVQFSITAQSQFSRDSSDIKTSSQQVVTDLLTAAMMGNLTAELLRLQEIQPIVQKSDRVCV